MRSPPAGLLVLALMSAACGPSALPDSRLDRESALGRTPGSASTLTFSADWTQSSTGALVAGSPVTIQYDPSRLRGCQNAPGWVTNGYFSLNGLPPTPLQLATAGGTTQPAFTPSFAGDLAVWFESSGQASCVAWDSNYGSNYHFSVAAPASAPGWVGNASALIDRATCGGAGPCYQDSSALQNGFTFGTWARQQAVVTQAFFDVWKQGVTDYANPDLWRQLDVELHARVGDQAPFTTTYVSFSEYTGNNARYALDLRALDLLPGNHGGALTDRSQCPAFPTTHSPDGQSLQADFQFYFTVNGVALQPSGGGVFHGLYQNYLGLYAVCGL